MFISMETVKQHWLKSTGNRLKSLRAGDSHGSYEKTRMWVRAGSRTFSGKPVTGCFLILELHAKIYKSQSDSILTSGVFQSEQSDEAEEKNDENGKWTNPVITFLHCVMLLYATNTAVFHVSWTIVDVGKANSWSPSNVPFVKICRCGATDALLNPWLKSTTHL